MFKTQRMDAFFPTLVWRFELEEDDAQELNKTIKPHLEKLTKTAPDLKEGDKWQTDQDLHLLDEYSGLMKFINHGVEQVLDVLSVMYESYDITGCWANISAVKARHMTHTHPNNFLSGVYYVETGSGSDTITIDDPRPQSQIIRPDVKQSNVENAHQMHLKVRTGDLIIFPSWLPHSVGFNMSPGLRTSIAFNAMFTNYTETISKPQWKGNINTGV